MSNFAIVLASGIGSRFRSDTPKQFLKLAGKTVLEHTLDAFEHHSRIDQIIIVLAPENRLIVQELVTHGNYSKVSAIVNGGSTRQESSAAGVNAITNDNSKVLVHDAVRPLLDAATIDRCLDALDEFEAVDTGIPSPDTIIRLDEDNCIADIPQRATLRLGQTPQAFRAGLLREAHRLASTCTDIQVTDDCGLVLHFSLAPVHVVAGDVNNIKITYPSDIYLADRLFQLRSNSVTSTLPETLIGKTIVIFGASRGIGQKITQLALKLGANVVSVSRADGVDVADTVDVRRVLADAVKLHGSIDAVVNTAGILRTGLLAGQNDADIASQIAINLQGSINVACESFAVMKQRGGSIVFFASSSYTRGRAGSVVYSATKAAVVNLMQGLAEEYLPFGVRINAINPERTATPMRTENFGNEPEESLLTAEVVAEATLKTLLSDRTGQVIDVRR